MLIRDDWGRKALAVTLTIGAMGLVGCRPSTKITDANSTHPAPVETETPATEPVDEQIPIPEGTAEELFQFLQDVESQELRLLEENAGETADIQQRTEAVQRLMRTRVRVCDKLLSADPSAETRATATQMKLDALRTLGAIEPERWAESFTQYCDELIGGDDPFLARVARAARFQGLVNDYMSVAEGDSEGLQTSLEELLKDPEAGAETFRAARDAAGWLVQAGRLAPAAEALMRVGQRFENDPDENLAAEAVKLLSQSTNLQLSQLARGVIEEQPNALDQLGTTIQTLLKSDSSDPNRLAYIMQTAQMLEYAGHADAALQTYELILEHYQAQPESQTTQTVERTVELARTRLGLIGQPLSIDGVLLDGAVFDWQDYRGKPILIVFWTTWYENWLQDVEQMRSAVRDYQPLGLEVITINLDDDRNVLERFLQTHPLPWPVVVNADSLSAGFEDPNAVRCGVEAVPLAILVDREGVVTDLHVLGSRLPAVLKKRLGGEQ